MLRIVALALSALSLLTGCTAEEQPSRPADSRAYIGVYFVKDDFLVPQYKVLPEGDPIRGVFDLLKDGPGIELLRTQVPDDAELLQEAEPGEGELVLDLSEEFWAGSKAEIETRVAQVLFTMSGLEEGRTITLLEGSTPASIEVAGNEAAQPLSAQDWPGPEPLFQVIQPVAGATVPADVPVQILAPRGARAYGIVSIDEVLGRRTRLDDGRGLLHTEVAGEDRSAKIVIVVLRDGDRASVSIPVTVSG